MFVFRIWSRTAEPDGTITHPRRVSHWRWMKALGWENYQPPSRLLRMIKKNDFTPRKSTGQCEWRLLSTTRRQRLSLSSGSRNNEAAPVPVLVVAILVQSVDWLCQQQRKHGAWWWCVCCERVESRTDMQICHPSGVHTGLVCKEVENMLSLSLASEQWGRRCD